MKKLEAKKDFTLDGVNYIVGDEVKVTDIVIIRKLNEKGFIKPLTYRELIILERELNKKEEE
jgi:hypothetical protein